MAEGEERKRRRSLRCSLRDAKAAAVMSGAGDAYVIPFALALHASPLQVGLISSCVGLLGALSQILGSRMVYRFRRRPLAVIAICMQGLIWLGLAGLAWWSSGKGGAETAVLLLIVLYATAAMAGGFAGPAWFSLMGDLVPESERGRFFSRRNRHAGLTAMAVTLLASLLLDRMKGQGQALAGFSLLFLVAATGRLVSGRFVAQYHEPPLQHDRQNYFTFWQFLRRALSNNFGRFALYISAINFAASFSAPFFAVYMLRDLQFSYLWFSAVNLSGGLFSILSMRLWGRFSDHFGNRALLRLASWVIPFPPLLWLVSPHPLFLVFVPQLLAGFGWAGFNLAASNFIYDSVTPGRRAICVAYFTMLNGIGVFAGAAAGGWTVGHVQVPWMDPIPFVFVLTCLMRLIISLSALPFIREVRTTTPLHLPTAMVNLFYLLAPRPQFGMIRGVRTLLFGTLWENENGKNPTEPDEKAANQKKPAP